MLAVTAASERSERPDGRYFGCCRRICVSAGISCGGGGGSDDGIGGDCGGRDGVTVAVRGGGLASCDRMGRALATPRPCPGRRTFVGAAVRRLHRASWNRGGDRQQRASPSPPLPTLPGMRRGVGAQHRRHGGRRPSSPSRRAAGGGAACRCSLDIAEDDEIRGGASRGRGRRRRQKRQRRRQGHDRSSPRPSVGPLRRRWGTHAQALLSERRCSNTVGGGARTRLRRISVMSSGAQVVRKDGECGRGRGRWCDGGEWAAVPSWLGSPVSSCGAPGERGHFFCGDGRSRRSRAAGGGESVAAARVAAADVVTCRVTDSVREDWCWWWRRWRYTA